MRDGKWITVFECICKEFRQSSWRDDRFFLDTKICPKCGTHNGEWEKKVVRITITKSSWFSRKEYNVEYLDEYREKNLHNLENLEKVFKII